MTARRLFLYLIGGVALTTALSIGIAFWLWGSVQSASDRLLVAQASEEQLRTRLESLAKLDRDYQNLTPRLTKIDQALPTPITPELVVSSVKAVASASGVSVGTFDFKAARSSTAGSIGYSLKVTGPYGAVQNFLARTATMTPLTDAITLTINKPVKEADTLEVSLQMVSHGGR